MAKKLLTFQEAIKVFVDEYFEHDTPSVEDRVQEIYDNLNGGNLESPLDEVVLAEIRRQVRARLGK